MSVSTNLIVESDLNEMAVEIMADVDWAMKRQWGRTFWTQIVDVGTRDTQDTLDTVKVNLRSKLT